MILAYNTNCKTVGTEVCQLPQEIKMPIYTASVLLLSVFSTYSFNRSCVFLVPLHYENSYCNSDGINNHIYFKSLCSNNNCRSFKILHWNKIYWRNLYAHSWKTGCLGLCQYLTSPVCKSQCFAKVHIMYVMRCALRIMTEWGTSSRTADLHLWSKTFKFRLRYRLSWQRLFVHPSRQVLGHYLAFNKSTSLLHPFPLTSLSSTEFTLCYPCYW